MSMNRPNEQDSKWTNFLRVGMANFTTSDEVCKKSLTGSTLPYAPLSLSKIDYLDPSKLLFMHTMDGNKIIMGSFLQHVYDKLDDISQVNEHANNALSSERKDRQIMERETQQLKEKYEEENRKLKEQLINKEDAYRRMNQKCVHLESVIIKSKREYRTSKKEFKRECEILNGELENLKKELYEARKKQYEAEDKQDLCKQQASVYINFERQRLNEKCCEVSKEKKACEKLMEQLKKARDEIKKVTDEKKELKKEFEMYKQESLDRFETEKIKLNEKCCEVSKEKKACEKLMEQLRKARDEIKKVTDNHSIRKTAGLELPANVTHADGIYRPKKFRGSSLPTSGIYHCHKDKPTIRRRSNREPYKQF